MMRIAIKNHCHTIRTPMENIQNVKGFIDSLNSSVAQLNTTLQPVVTRSLEELVSTNAETPLERIALYNNYLYTLISVLYSHLKALGTDTNSHPIMKELNRIKAYMKRLKDYEALLLSQKASRDKLLEKSKAYIENTLGLVAVNGGGAAQTESLLEPAISKVHFQGAHTRFEEQEKSIPKLPKKPTTPGKVSKPAKPTRAKKTKK